MYMSTSLADAKKGKRSSSAAGRNAWRLVALVAVGFFLFTYKRRHDNALEGNELVYRKPTMKSKLNSMLHAPTHNKDWPSLNVLREFWTDLALVLETTKPTNPAPKHAERPPSIVIDGADQYTLEMTETEITTMRNAHRSFVQQASSLSLLNTYLPGTRGIVTTAGGKYIPIFLVSLRLLRRTGSNLPVEVFLANDLEYDADLCEKVLPALNAKCRVLTHVLSAASNIKISSYQFKIFALLFSSFEDNLFIDADNLVINDPLPMLTNEPFASTGMVLWPDFWPSTVSPIFYDILGTEEPASAGGKTSETGQILISKRLHGQTLLLSTYYNLFGPNYYYSLLSQGAPGEGDKETFSAAADFLRIPFYQVKSEVAAMGFFDVDNNNEFMGGAMLQYDPIVDADSYGHTKRPEPSFVHANTPKFDPNTILDQGMTRFRSGKSHRMWHDIHEQQDVHFSWGKDPERAVFEEMIVVACQDQSKFDTHKASPACYDLRKHYIDVFGVLPGRVDNVQRR